MELSFIIVNWNTIHLLKPCLESIAAHCVGLDYEIIVVDNASTDGSVEQLRREYPQLTLIANAANGGFAAANNQGAARAAGRYLLLLNPDTIVLPGAIPELLRYADAHPRVGILGPRLLNPDGTRQRSCWPAAPGLGMAFSDALYLWKWRWWPRWLTYEFKESELEQPRSVAHILGACMLIRRAVWEQIGPMNESYFMYLEESDYCFRAARVGWPVVFLPAAAIIHIGQQSSRQAPAQNLRHLYASTYQFCKQVRRYSATQLLLLKGVMQLAALTRIGLWAWRSWRAQTATDRDQAQAMRAGYAEVLPVVTRL